MVGIPPIYGDDWGMVYYCYANIIQKNETFLGYHDCLVPKVGGLTLMGVAQAYEVESGSRWVPGKHAELGI